MSEWLPILDGLLGLSKEEKRRAKLIILDKDKEDRPLYFTGDSEDVTRNMIDLLRLADGGERMPAAVLPAWSAWNAQRWRRRAWTP